MSVAEQVLLGEGDVVGPRDQGRHVLEVVLGATRDEARRGPFHGSRQGRHLIDPDLDVHAAARRHLEEMAQELPVDHIIVEADGAKGLPLKAPGEQEPVIPSATTLLIPIVGIDAVGKPLNKEQAFRPERIAELTGTKLGDPITPHLIGTLMVHPQGLCKGVPSGARIVPFINKVETTEGLTKAREVAQEVLAEGHEIERVVLSKLFFHYPIVEIIERRN